MTAATEISGAGAAGRSELDHRALIGRLSRDERRTLLERSDRRGLLQLAGHWGAILAVGSLIAWRIPGWQFLLPVQGVLVIFLFTALHETIHRTAFRTPALNNIVAQVCGFLVFVPAEWFRHFHFEHHRHTQDPERDPELAVPKPATLRDYVVHLSGLPIWVAFVRVFVMNALDRNRDAFVPDRERATVRLEARLYLALYAGLLAGSIAAGSALLLWVWVAPVLLGQPVLRAYLMTEHTGCPQVANMLANSRTVLAGPLVRFIAWNMPYHAEHHALPSAPFHRLPALHRIARPHLAAVADSHAAVHRDFLARLKHDKQRS